MRLRQRTIGLAVLVLVSAAAADELRNVKVGQDVPPFTVPTLAGDELKSSELHGKVVVLVYVAAEQQSSERAVQAASALGRELRNQDLKVIFLTADATQVGFFRQQRDRLGIHEPLGLDAGREVYGALGVFVLPTTIIIDRDDRLALVMSSYKSDYEHVLGAHVQHALGLIDDAELEKQLSFKQFQHGLPEKVARHRAAARLLRENGLLPDAENELRAALELDAENTDALLDLAALLTEQKRLDEAEVLVAKVSAVDPGNRRLKLESGIILYRQGRFDDAERLLGEALLLNPDPVRTHYYLGLIKEHQGDQSAAIMHFKEALKRLLKEPA